MKIKKTILKEDIEKKIKEIKPFFEQLTFFFLFLLLFILFDTIFKVPALAKYTITVLLSGWSISLIVQELYLYKIFKPVLLNNKRWEELARKGFKTK